MRKFLRKALLLAATSSILSLNVFAAEICRFQGNSNQVDLHYSGIKSGSLTVPKDAPAGTVIYEETLTASSQSFICPDAGYLVFQLNPIFGKVLSGSSFPLGNSGLSLRVYTNGHPVQVESRISADPQIFPSREYKIEIYKSDNLSSQNTIPQGLLGAHYASGITLVRLYLDNPIILNTASCQTPSTSVAMGDDYELGEFREVGATQRTVRWNITLTGCQSGIKKVTYSLKATTPVIDAAKGVVALNNTSTATGIGLQLMHDAGQPVALNTNYAFNAFTTTGTDFKIPFSAAYYRLPNGDLNPGSANTEVTFIVNYL